MDIFIELCSVLRTRFSDQCYYIKLTNNKDSSGIFNNITYFAAYITFNLWFIQVIISILQDACGNRLKAKDKCFVAMVSMVFAMHVLWPLLLSLTHFLICALYPWSTAVVVLLLNICLITALMKMPHLNLFSKISFSINYIKRMLSFRTPTESITASIYPDEDGISLTGEYFTASSVTPAVQPRMAMLEEHGPTAVPDLQHRITPIKQVGPFTAHAMEPRIAPTSQRESSQTLVKQSITVEESRGILDASRIQPQLIIENPCDKKELPETQTRINLSDLYKAFQLPKIHKHLCNINPHRELETPTIRHRTAANTETYRSVSELPVTQARVDPTDLHKAFQLPKIRSHLCQTNSHRELETPTIRHQTAVIREPCRSSEESQIQHRSLVLESGRNETIHIKISEDLASNGSLEHLKCSENAATPRKASNQIGFKDLSQQGDSNRNGVKTVAPKRNRFKASKENGGGDQGSQSKHNVGYCERCGKMNSRPELTHTTRSGTVYSATDIFCKCINL